MVLRRVLVLAAVCLWGGVVWGVNAQDLLDDLNKATGQKQIEAALRLADFNYPEVVTALSARLDDAKTDVTVRAACAGSLGKLNDPSTCPMIEALARKPEEKTIVRTACIRAMAVMKAGDAIPELVEMVKAEKNPMVQRTIEEALAGMKDAQRVALAVSPLLQDELAAPSAIRVLGVVGGPAVIVPLSLQLTSPKASIRQAVIRALGEIGHPDAVPPLLDFYPKGNEAEKVQILSALANHPHPLAVKLMTEELENPKTYAPLRQRSALTLGNLVARPAVKTLVKIMLNTAEPTGLRLTCAQALGNFGDHDDEAIAGLIGALADKRIADTAAVSLSRVTKCYHGTSKEKWTEWFQKWLQERDREEHIGH
jgi:HEAT repeat protein